MNIKKISIIIPAFKAESFIVDTVKNVEKVLKSIKTKYEIICVIDGLVDNTFENISKYSKGKKSIKVLKYEDNKGKGFAVRYGMKRAKGNVVGFIDAGNEIDPRSLKNLIHVYENHNADIVVGSKKHPDSKIDYPFYRRLMSYLYFIYVKSLFDIEVSDTQAGIKIFKKEVVIKLIPELKINGFAFDIELLSKAKKLGFRKIFEAPITVDMKRSSKNYSTMKGFTFIISTSRMFWDTLVVFSQITRHK